MDIHPLMDSLWAAVKCAREQEKKLPETMHLLRHFRHRYENSHSDVLAFMLNPQSRRSQNAEFLRLFLEQVGFDKIPSPEDLSKAHILRENGRVDLLILLPNTCIIIENKVDAEDQPAQLARYYQHVKENYPHHENIYILYLSLDGKEPSEQSIGEGSEDYQKELKAIEQLKENGCFKCISYKKDIYQWLQKALGNITKGENFLETKGRLFSAVDQYLYNVEVLTGQTKGDNIMSEEVLKRLIEWEANKFSPIESTNKELVNFYQSVQDELPALIYYHECKGMENDLKKNNFSVQYFSNLCKIDDTKLLTEIKLGNNIGVGIPVSDIPILHQKNLKNTFIVYELQGNRDSVQFGLTTADMADPEFQLGDKLDTFIEEAEYQKAHYWHFIFHSKRSWYPGGVTEEICKWFKELHNFLTKDAL